METENNIWNLITDSLKSKISSSDIKTWFSQANLNHLDNNKAVIEVPNKFIATWLHDNYLDEIKIAFKKILQETPEIQFQYNHKEAVNLTHKDKDNSSDLKNCLNKLMTFDNFIIGDYNQFAFSSSFEVANNNGSYYNPLYIYSKSGHGKTHLLNAIGNYVINKYKFNNVYYIYAKKFISDFNYSLVSKNFDELRKKYLNLDVLLFDDIDHLINKKIQEEFLSIFNKLYDEKKQIIITGENPPNKLINFNSQLRSRLGGGLITEIKEIDKKNKLNIIKNKLKEKNINLPNDIIFYLIKSTNNIKVLLKNIIRIETYTSLNNNSNINISLIKSLIKDDNNFDINISDIQAIISGYFNISIKDLISNKKTLKYSYPRHLAMYLSRKYTKMSFQEIGHNFGGKDHSTIIYAIKKIETSKKNKKEILNDLTNIENLLT
jgi:chromosomal replication initiator protein